MVGLSSDPRAAIGPGWQMFRQVEDPSRPKGAGGGGDQDEWTLSYL